MKTLDEIAAYHGTDKSTVHSHPHGYAPHYARYFDPIRERKLRVMEIGVGGGESIKTWLEFFPNANVFGVDIDHDTNPWNTPGKTMEPRYQFLSGDQASDEFWDKSSNEIGSDWDIIIDDGGHHTKQIVPAFNWLWPHVNAGGYYCIEDLACAYNSIYVSAGFPGHIDFIAQLLHNANRGELGIGRVCFSRELAIIQKE